MMKFNDRAYWEKVYKNFISSNAQVNPSDFAKFVVGKGLLKPSSIVYELGCGTGRDSIFFAKKGAEVVAIDQCPNITKHLNNFDKIKAIASDFTSPDDIINQSIRNPDLVYSRFTLHSVDESAEDRTLKWVNKHLKPNGLFCIEARTIQDDLYGKGEHKGGTTWFYNNHHRRFLDSKNFLNKCLTLGFSLKYFNLDKGLAVHKDEDPIVLRIILSKAE